MSTSKKRVNTPPSVTCPIYGAPVTEAPSPLPFVVVKNACASFELLIPLGSNPSGRDRYPTIAYRSKEPLLDRTTANVEGPSPGPTSS